jgi:thiosulfate/3-mercaptopyruvate sulfurtransferase
MDLSEHKCLVGTDWLGEHLHDANLVVVEATSLLPNYFEDTVIYGIEKESGRQSWEQDHISGSTYIGILEEISDTQNDRFMYGLPTAEKFTAVMSRNGIGNDSAVVIYDRATNMWAARLWWMLRVFGFNNAVVLDGGYTKWTAENRPIDNKIVTPSVANFRSKFQPEVLANRDRVLDATMNENVCLINTLVSDEFEGRPPQRYQRSGHIPSSVNVPWIKTVNVDSQLYSEDAGARSAFEAVGASSAEEIICYCGGGIAACSAALLLTHLGFDNVSVYDGSMTEWAADSSLPLESGPVN